MARIFISYSRKDAEFARKLAKSLSDLGADVWIDVEDIPAGLKWSSAIQQGLQTADAMIVLISPDSMASTNVEDEWQYYLDQKKPLFPVLIKPAELHFQISRVQYIDFHNQRYETAFEQLRNQLLLKGISLTGQVSVSPPAQQPVPTRETRQVKTWMIGAAGAAVLLVIVALGIVLSGNLGQQPAPTETPTDSPTASETPPAPTDAPTNSPTDAADTQPVARNSDWAPVTQYFDGVLMAFVPAGCFRMGENGEGGQQCFDESFWIDVYEVTNAQYGSEGDFSGDNRPRDSVTWFEARDFCLNRGARLPTEAEWEYAARGPEGFIYPWGNNFIAENVVYGENSGEQSAEVGSRQEGLSWVGALDMSGNLREWTSTIYLPYPYDPDDGRENESDDTSPRVLRGGAWFNNEFEVSAAWRVGDPPAAGAFNHFGFRCAATFSG